MIGVVVNHLVGMGLKVLCRMSNLRIDYVALSINLCVAY